MQKKEKFSTIGPGYCNYAMSECIGCSISNRVCRIDSLTKKLRSHGANGIWLLFCLFAATSSYLLHSNGPVQKVNCLIAVIFDLGWCIFQCNLLRTQNYRHELAQIDLSELQNQCFSTNYQSIDHHHPAKPCPLVPESCFQKTNYTIFLGKHRGFAAGIISLFGFASYLNFVQIFLVPKPFQKSSIHGKSGGEKCLGSIGGTKNRLGSAGLKICPIWEVKNQSN